MTANTNESAPRERAQSATQNPKNTRQTMSKPESVEMGRSGVSGMLSKVLLKSVGQNQQNASNMGNIKTRIINTSSETEF